MLNFVRRLYNIWEKWLANIANVPIFLLMYLTTADMGGWYIFNRPIIWVYDIIAFYLVVGGVSWHKI